MVVTEFKHEYTLLRFFILLNGNRTIFAATRLIPVAPNTHKKTFFTGALLVTCWDTLQCFEDEGLLCVQEKGAKGKGGRELKNRGTEREAGGSIPQNKFLVMALTRKPEPVLK